MAWCNALPDPHHATHNPTNQSYSTHVSGYLLIGTGLWFRLHERWWLNGTINYQHESNGGLKEPNKGINWPTAGLAVSYLPQPRPYYQGVYLYNPTNYFEDIYHRWGIHYRVGRHLGVGFNLMAHRHVADFIDLRATWSWPR